MQEENKHVELGPIYADKRTTTDQEKKNTQTTADGFSLSTALTGALLALLIALPVTYKYIEDKLDGVAANQHKIAAIDFSAILAAQAEQGASESEISEAVTQLNAVVGNLTASGFIVLDGSSVLSAPEDIFISNDLLSEVFTSGE